MALTVFFHLVVYFNVNCVKIYHEKSQWPEERIAANSRNACDQCIFYSFTLHFKCTLVFIKKIALYRARTIYKLLHVGSGNSCCCQC